MVTIIVQLLLYMVLVALVKQLTQISGLWASVAVGIGFTIITMVPYDWVTLPICFGLLLFAFLMRREMTPAITFGVTLALSLGLGGLLYYGDQHSLFGGMSDVPGVSDTSNMSSTALSDALTRAVTQQ